MENPLERLTVSGEALDRELLATVLQGLVMVETGTGEIRFTSRVAKLAKRTQILLLLLGRKASSALGFIEDEAISPSEMETKLGMKGGPLRGQLSQLRKERLVQSDGGKYTVPSYAVENVGELVQSAARSK